MGLRGGGVGESSLASARVGSPRVLAREAPGATAGAKAAACQGAASSPGVGAVGATSCPGGDWSPSEAVRKALGLRTTTGGEHITEHAGANIVLGVLLGLRIVLGVLGQAIGRNRAERALAETASARFQLAAQRAEEVERAARDAEQAAQRVTAEERQTESKAEDARDGVREPPDRLLTVLLHRPWVCNRS